MHRSSSPHVCLQGLQNTTTINWEEHHKISAKSRASRAARTRCLLAVAPWLTRRNTPAQYGWTATPPLVTHRKPFTRSQGRWPSAASQGAAGAPMKSAAVCRCARTLCGHAGSGPRGTRGSWSCTRSCPRMCRNVALMACDVAGRPYCPRTLCQAFAFCFWNFDVF